MTLYDSTLLLNPDNDLTVCRALGCIDALCRFLSPSAYLPQIGNVVDTQRESYAAAFGHLGND